MEVKEAKPAKANWMPALLITQRITKVLFAASSLLTPTPCSRKKNKAKTKHRPFVKEGKKRTLEIIHHMIYFAQAAPCQLTWL